MALPAIAAIAAAAAPIVGGYVGGKKREPWQNWAEDYYEKALAKMSGLEVPELSMPEAQEFLQNYQPEDLTQINPYSPEFQNAVQQGPSAMEQISTDPAVRQKQLEALNQMAAVSQDGMTPQDEFALAQMQADINRRERGSREAILQNMAERGLSGSGVELAAQLQNQQAAAERANLEGLGLQASGRERALQAMAMSGDMAGQLRGQDYSEAAQVAAAQDAIARFNANQQSDVQAANVAAKNAAAQQQYQTALQNALNKQAAGYANQDAKQQLYQNLMGQEQMKQDRFGTELDLAKAQSGQMETMAQYKDYRGGQEAEKYSGMGTGISKGILGAFGGGGAAPTAPGGG